MADQEAHIPTGDVQAAQAVLAADDRSQPNPVESHPSAQAQEPPPQDQEPPPPAQQVPAATATSADITLAVCTAFNLLYQACPVQLYALATLRYLSSSFAVWMFGY